jgi:hypothetical protein
MVNVAVVEYKDTVRSWIWIHHSKKPLQPSDKLISVVGTFLYVAIDNAIHGEGR